MSQRRWHDASHLLERALRGIWPSLFSTNVYDITLVHEQVEECVDLVRRLAECYSIRQRKAEEEDIRVRLYRAMRSGGKVDDKLWEQVTQELLSFYTKTRQNEAGITKIIRVLNGDGLISKPEDLKPILLVATELQTKGAFSEAMLYYKTFFSTFFAVPKSSPTFQDQTLMRECFDRYLEFLRHTKMAFSVVHKVSSEYQSHGLFQNRIHSSADRRRDTPLGGEYTVRGEQRRAKVAMGEEKLRWKSKVMLIMDEISQVGGLTLAAVDSRLRQYRDDSRRPFGGVPIVIFFGDFYQFEPVQQTSLLLPRPRGHSKANPDSQGST
ncbi:hypothetical protein PG987_004909 [Apiospora arundinis]